MNLSAGSHAQSKLVNKNLKTVCCFIFIELFY